MIEAAILADDDDHMFDGCGGLDGCGAWWIIGCPSVAHRRPEQSELDKRNARKHKMQTLVHHFES
jgi:hypothetical protein